MSLIQIGRLGRPHGVRGEVVLDRVSLTASELETIGAFVWRGSGGDRELRLAGVRSAHDRMLVSFEGIQDRDGAARLTHGLLLAPREQVPDAGPGRAFTFELVGLRVVDGSGRALGVVRDIIGAPGHPVYVVQGDREWLVPAVEPVVRRVDLQAGVITVELPAGLEDV